MINWIRNQIRLSKVRANYINAKDDEFLRYWVSLWQAIDETPSIIGGRHDYIMKIYVDHLRAVVLERIGQTRLDALDKTHLDNMEEITTTARNQGMKI